MKWSISWLDQSCQNWKVRIVMQWWWCWLLMAVWGHHLKQASHLHTARERSASIHSVQRSYVILHREQVKVQSKYESENWKVFQTGREWKWKSFSLLERFASIWCVQCNTVQRNSIQKQARKARRCDSYLQIWNYQWLTHSLTHWLTGVTARRYYRI